ncbi:lysophosphatidic acid receptor 5 [Sarcophilus harrisii]|uniref:Lysophosphatidic acid receptor 5 n=1 Tax=Sarcophilus harrisii TaxID=9305 RepID=G3WR60_SARHA|nr:lysophosphatidic acid receptor 5 [Sarcophilus harrisii]XP_023360318.1 lysophosphatidic acid receptor 5 [Sarcophilus harrisii]XP_023360319.1 lysophosphatidic acid receptor 5 [Sarcophilus harrisii]XP_031794136.1 lysophosphatidic acid receptor 5 [Sarcophilus harrisii]
MSANSTSNGPDIPACPDYRLFHRLHLVGYSLVLATGLPLNALALWVFLRALQVHSVVSVYMCNLAASDLLFTLSLPLRISYYALHYWPLPDLLCQTAGAAFQMNMYGSCIFLALINMDRYVAIVHPLRLRHLRRPMVARLLCLGVWALILVCAVPAARVHAPSPCYYENITVNLCFESFSEKLWQGKLLPLVLLAEGLGFILPLITMIYSSSRVFWTLARPSTTRSERRRKTVRLLLANLVIFLLCFVPYNTALAVYGLLRGKLVDASSEARDKVRQVLVVMVVLASANCVLDPLVYYFSAEGFRNTLRDLGTTRWVKVRSANGSQGLPRQRESGNLSTNVEDTSHCELLSPTPLEKSFSQSIKDSTI